MEKLFALLHGMRNERRGNGIRVTFSVYSCIVGIWKAFLWKCGTRGEKD
jgi:hypothetical protein